VGERESGLPRLCGIETTSSCLFVACTRYPRHPRHAACGGAGAHARGREQGAASGSVEVWQPGDALVSQVSLYKGGVVLERQSALGAGSCSWCLVPSVVLVLFPGLSC
jgi:hypothetical protein